MALEQGKKVNWAEKDKDLLQMIIGGTACNACGICKEYRMLQCFAHNILVSQEYTNSKANTLTPPHITIT